VDYSENNEAEQVSGVSENDEVNCEEFERSQQEGEIFERG